jgi:hypothetical protein
MMGSSSSNPAVQDSMLSPLARVPPGASPGGSYSNTPTSIPGVSAFGSQQQQPQQQQQYSGSGASLGAQFGSSSSAGAAAGGGYGGGAPRAPLSAATTPRSVSNASALPGTAAAPAGSTGDERRGSTASLGGSGGARYSGGGGYASGAYTSGAGGVSGGGSALSAAEARELMDASEGLLQVTGGAAAAHSAGLAAQRSALDGAKRLVQRLQAERVSLTALLEGAADEAAQVSVLVYTNINLF